MTATSTDEIVSVGPWRLALRGAELADVTFRGTLVLRAVRFVVRDHDWRTADDTVLTRTVAGDDRCIRIETSARYDGVEVVRTVLEATLDDDTLRVAAVGTVTRAFRRNRVGLVVLHPPALAGQPLTVRHPSGGSTATAFPFWIAPHQPAADIAGLAWATGPVTLSLDLTGDVFEMEDQRNWTDASFKTYSTPLAEPFPVALSPGTTVRQGLTLRATAVGPAGGPGTRSGGAASPAPGLAALDGPGPGAVVTAPPTLQLLAGSAPVAARPDDTDLLRGFPILVEPTLGAPDFDAVLASARRDAGGAPLDVRFVTDDPVLLRAAIDVVLEAGPVVRFVAFDPVSHVTTPALQRALREAVAAVGALDVVAGTRAHFTELNRSIALFARWDGPLTFSVTPQMHDRSPEQVTESIRMQRWVVSSASRLAAGRALHVGPVTLRPRWNAVATATAPARAVTDATVERGYGPETVPDATDPAQHTPAAERWFADAVRALTVPGVASITLAEAWGPRGFVAADGTGNAPPEGGRRGVPVRAR
ncbi:hypothetical protein [Curtobacterium sp. VKM Ac-1376]|uniref:hypothetical protein n=1 Tax=Curtobacterium sp. VKM Ac-1376 TaxID=123312 RepID=UPI00188A0EA8|nr:hypothetical protein [Curtobacterium sp. VKM Ac-1376]MBF4616132.1 hypothetical protein [Curtobacterium sp. VKM Ac-1376]